jgi:hypothetical protein
MTHNAVNDEGGKAAAVVLLRAGEVGRRPSDGPAAAARCDADLAEIREHCGEVDAMLVSGGVLRGGHVPQWI